VLGIKARALYIPGKWSATELHPRTLSATSFIIYKL
jgi:hypothetical protein